MRPEREAEPAAEQAPRDAIAAPPLAGPRGVLALQRRAGNRAVMSALRLQRTIEMRDVGRGEASGFGRLDEILDRLNALSPHLVWFMSGNRLRHETWEEGALTSFEAQMTAFAADTMQVLPMRLTNRHGLLGTRATGFVDRVGGDHWTSGYVDVDDLLASSDLGFQTLLVHFLTERARTRNYARRLGALDDTSAEFRRAHRAGLGAEVEVLRDFFGDPTIRFVREPDSGQIFRIFRNARGDTIRTRVRLLHGADAGVDQISLEVVTRDGTVHTPEAYRDILAAERAAAP